MHPADLRSRDFQRILLIKLSAVGDVVHTIPVLNMLRRRFPAAQIDWLTRPATADLVRLHPAVTTVIEFRRDAWRGSWRRPWHKTPLANAMRLAARLRSARYDLVLDLQGQVRSAAFALAAAAPVRIGFDRPRAAVWTATARQFPAQTRRHAWQGAREGSWLAYTHRIPVPTLDRHAVDRYLGVGPMLGIDPGPPDFSFPIPPDAAAPVDTLLRRHGAAGVPFVILAPGTIWETKHWGSEKFAAVAQHVMREGFAALVVGSPRERDLCAEVARLAPGAIDVAGETTLMELAALIRRAALCVTNDSGPMHLAVALDRPVVSVFGPTHPGWVGPYRRDSDALQLGLPCSPCYLRTLDRCMHDHACMRDLPAAAVIERAESLLRRAGGAQALRAVGR